MSRDRRRRVLEGALFSPDLSYAEKVLMVVVVTIKPEHVNGERRHGTKAMGPDGKFALHVDYLAAALNASPNAVRKLRRQLEQKEYLTLVHEGTFGRPTTWQALTVRGAKNGRVTGGGIGTPYGLGDWLIRVAESAPLTYRTPADGDPSPTLCVSPAPQITESSSNEQQPCRYHGWATCPVDCADHPETRRRTA